MDALFVKIGLYVSAGIYFLSFILFFLTHSKSTQRNFLAITFITNSLCSLFLVYYNTLNNNIILIIETLRNIFWITLLTGILKYSIKSISLKKMLKILPVFVFFVEIIIIKLFTNDKFFISFHLSQSILVLFIIEQIFRRTNETHKWKIKPLCIGLGLIYTYDFALYSDALLVNTIDETIFLGKGWISLLATPFILLSIRRIQNWSMRIYVSRNIVFNSTLLITSGTYLLSMSIIGYFINYLNYTWSNLAQHIFLSLSFVLFSFLFYSDAFRYKLKKFIIRHFYENKYDYCAEWTSFSETLENKAETPYHIALSSMMKPFKCFSGALFQLDGERLSCKAKKNVDTVYQIDLLTDLAKKAIEHRWIIDLDELKENQKKQPFNFEVIKILNIEQVKYIIPILEPGNVKFVCMLPSVNHSNKMDFEDRELLRVLSKHLSIYLDLHITNNYLVENQQFIAFNQMSTFLVHDLKNVLAQLNLISENSKKHRNNEDFIDDTFITIQSASLRLNKVLSHLLKHKFQEYNLEIINICDTVTKAFNERALFSPQPFLADHFNAPVFIKADKEKMFNIFLNLIKNAQDACKVDGQIKIFRINKKNYFGIAIEDNGEGMTEDFITNRLFKPFDTTKGNAGLGVGAYDAKKFIEQINGYMDVISTKNLGSRFEIYIPLHENQDAFSEKSSLATES